MQSFAPEFARFWLPSQGAGAGEAKADRGDDDTPAQQAALEELAERVSLARSITSLIAGRRASGHVGAQCAAAMSIPLARQIPPGGLFFDMRVPLAGAQTATGALIAGQGA